jgi:hypothetical protein
MSKISSSLETVLFIKSSLKRRITQETTKAKSLLLVNSKNTRREKP